MRALDSLEQDHRLLWRLTEALEAYAAALEAGLDLRAGDLRDIVQSFRTVADYRNFEKVEEVLIPVLVRHGFDYNLEILDDGRRVHEKVRYLLEVLHQSAERDLNWNLDERARIVRAARSLVEEQRRLAAQREAELFPEIESRIPPPALGQLTEQLCQFDEQSDSRWPEVDVAALSQSVLARYASTLPSARELAR